MTSLYSSSQRRLGSIQSPSPADTGCLDPSLRWGDVDGGRNDATCLASRPAAGRRGRRHHLAETLSKAAIALIILGGAAAVQAQAPIYPRAPADEGFEPADDVLGELPDRLLGIEARRMGRSLVEYAPPPLVRGPKVGVVAVLWTETTSERKLRSFARGRFQKQGLHRIFREGSFTTPKWPAARTFFGEYATGNGFKQSWTAETGRERIAVVATYYDKADAPRVQAEVADKIFGGAVVTAAKP